jgi:hypothetical protein
MTVSTRATIAAAAMMSTALAAAMSPAQAGTGWRQHEQLTLACENGRTYPLQPRGVSVAGEVVTGYLVVSPRHRIHMRLIPMGDGYRYAGRGVWFDGVRGDAQLFDGPSRSVACSVISS